MIGLIPSPTIPKTCVPPHSINVRDQNIRRGLVCFWFRGGVSRDVLPAFARSVIRRSVASFLRERLRSDGQSGSGHGARLNEIATRD